METSSLRRRLAPQNHQGYAGAGSAEELTDVGNLPFTAASAILFGARNSQCYSGMLVFLQGNLYGVIDPVSIDADGTLSIDWWLGEPGVVDFSGAPGIPTPTSAPVPPTATPTPTPTATAAAEPVVVQVEIASFTHSNVTVAVGTTVVWVNMDRVQHTSTSGTGPGALSDV